MHPYAVGGRFTMIFQINKNQILTNLLRFSDGNRVNLRNVLLLLEKRVDGRFTSSVYLKLVGLPVIHRSECKERTLHDETELTSNFLLTFSS